MIYLINTAFICWGDVLTLFISNTNIPVYQQSNRQIRDNLRLVTSCVYIYIHVKQCWQQRILNYNTNTSLTQIRGGFSELGAPGKYRNGALYICTHLPDQPWGSFFAVMLAAAQWCPIVVSNVSTFSCTRYNGILSFTFIHLADTSILSGCRPRNSNWFTVEIQVNKKRNKL